MIDWNESLSVGNSILDEQHQRLIDIINGFHEEVVSHPENELTIIPRVLDKLFDYVQYHFETEEEMMETAGYPDLENHRKTHRAIKEKLFDIKDRLVRKEIVISLELVVFFEEWLVNHILGVDMEYKGKLHT